MVSVGIVTVRVHQWFVAMRMRVWLAGRITNEVLVPMVIVMNV